MTATRERSNGVLKALLAVIVPLALVAIGWFVQDRLALARDLGAMEARIDAQERLQAELTERLVRIEDKIDRLIERQAR